MTKRYFKATNGTHTVFRASDTRVYASAAIPAPRVGSTTRLGYGISFSAKPACPGVFPAVEITKAEYDALTALKLRRMRANGERIQYATSPQNSWVANDAIEAEAICERQNAEGGPPELAKLFQK